MLFYGHYLKILDSIVSLIMINVMDYFCSKESSTDMVRHYFSMDVSEIHSASEVSIYVLMNSSFPVTMMRTTHKNISAFFGTKFISGMVYLFYKPFIALKAFLWRFLSSAHKNILSLPCTESRKLCELY